MPSDGATGGLPPENRPQSEAVDAPDPAGPQCIFLFTGEGAHSADTDLSSLQLSPSWSDVAAAVRRVAVPPDEAWCSDSFGMWLQRQLGDHSAPHSPVVTTAISIL